MSEKNRHPWSNYYSIRYTTLTYLALMCN